MRQHRVSFVPRMSAFERQSLEDALGFYETFYKEAGSDPEIVRETARAYRMVGDIRLLLGRYQQAEAAYARALDLQHRQGGPPPRRDDRQELARTHLARGTLFLILGRQ